MALDNVIRNARDSGVFWDLRRVLYMVEKLKVEKRRNNVQRMG